MSTFPRRQRVHDAYLIFLRDNNAVFRILGTQRALLDTIAGVLLTATSRGVELRGQRSEHTVSDSRSRGEWRVCNGSPWSIGLLRTASS